MKAWHFVTNDKRLGYRDGRIVEVGNTYEIPDKSRPIKLCEYGMHASVRALDALQYAPGYVCCLVELGGKIIEGDDKVVAESRKVLKMIDATNILHEMACISAETALRIADVQDPRCWQSIEAKRAWVRGEISDSELAAAMDAAIAAAIAAARDAARAAARAAVRDAAIAAARAAAIAAARDAAMDAARAAAIAAAWDAAMDEQNAVLESMLMEAMQ